VRTSGAGETAPRDCTPADYGVTPGETHRAAAAVGSAKSAGAAGGKPTASKSATSATKPAGAGTTKSRAVASTKSAAAATAAAHCVAAPATAATATVSTTTPVLSERRATRDQ
jgi:hypothetical protein